MVIIESDTCEVFREPGRQPGSRCWRARDRRKTVRHPEGCPMALGTPRHCRRKLSPSAERGQLRQRKSSGQPSRPELVTVEVRGFVSSCDCKSLVPDRRRDREVSLMCNCSACKPWLFLLVDGERPRSGKVSWKAEWALWHPYCYWGDK